MLNLIFDVDDTLYDQLLPFRAAYADVFCGLYPISDEELYIKSRHYSDKVFHLVETNAMSLKDMHEYRISKAFADFGIKISSEEALTFQQAYEKRQNEIELSNEMKKVLNFCKDQQVVTGIITNGPADHQKKKIKHLDLDQWIAPDKIFISEELNMAKPDKRLFHHVQNAMRLDPVHTFYLGDSYRNDVLGAKAAGWKAIWLNRRSDPLLKDLTIIPDYTLKRENEILGLLRSLKQAHGM